MSNNNNKTRQDKTNTEYHQQQQQVIDQCLIELTTSIIHDDINQNQKESIHLGILSELGKRKLTTTQ
ncbi:hypothetical protein BLOT_009995 [Blomia tropicalis]|nr:hypothetical protein BLOT_009995 [Blomia tropicalis]